MAGLFINVIPVRIKVIKTSPFQQIKQVQNQALASGKHEYCSLAQIQSINSAKARFADHILEFENYPVEKIVSTEENQKHRIDDVQLFMQTNDFNVSVIPRGALGIRIRLMLFVYDREFVESIQGIWRGSPGR